MLETHECEELIDLDEGWTIFDSEGAHIRRDLAVAKHVKQRVVQVA